MEDYKMGLFFTRKFSKNEAQPPPDVKEAFASFTGGTGQMTPEQLRRFMVEFQGDAEATVTDAEAILHQIGNLRNLPQSSTPVLALEDFHHYLFSDDLNAPINSQVCQDMTAPLSHYYIYTGHNSYLTGNQLSSDSSVTPIIEALKRGVRVIELDMWPNSTNDNIDILHGRTLTDPVELIECLISIKEYAFSVSLYPVVITLEDHLTPALQAKVAEMFTQTFGEMLFTPETECLAEFPSPESLKRRIIISTKPPKEYLQYKNTREGATKPKKGKASREEEAWGREFPDVQSDPDFDDKSGNDDSDHSQGEEDLDDADQKSCLYKRLITIRAEKPKGDLKDALKVDPNTVRRLSLSEQELEKASVSHGTDVVRFTQRNMLRIYPKGTRFNSSNYNPLIGWIHGAQMVAFNMQGYGRSLWLMHGMFRANGSCGYVKKPDFLMKVGPDNQVFDPRSTLHVKTTLMVKVYMGDGWRIDFEKTHFDTYSPPDFYAWVGIAGVPADSNMKKTKKVADDWVPVWNKEFTFPLTVPELALLRIEVHENDMSQKDDFGGQTCLPVSELRTGIRTVPLFDQKGERFESVKLLMRFMFV